MIRIFELFLGHACKVIKDYMKHQNFVFDELVPKLIIKEAFAAKIINNPQEFKEEMSVVFNALEKSNTLGFNPND